MKTKRQGLKRGSKEWREAISNTLLGRRCCPETEFATGHIPWNKENYARVVWREHHGSITPNEIIFHKDGDIFNNDIDNLETISRAELLRRNSKPVKKMCANCGKEFMARRKNVLNCSRKCSQRYAQKKWISENHERWRELQRRYRMKRKSLNSPL